MAGSVRNLPPLRILDLDLHEHNQSAGVDDARAVQQVAGLRAGRPEIVEGSETGSTSRPGVSVVIATPVTAVWASIETHMARPYSQ